LWTFVDAIALVTGPDSRTAVAATAAVIRISLQIDTTSTAIGFIGSAVGYARTLAADLVVLTVVVASPAMSGIVHRIDAGAVALCCTG